MPYPHMRSARVERFLNDTCEVGGAPAQGEMHPVRKLADLNKQGKRARPLWMKIMIARKRKSIPLCKRCHDDRQHRRPKVEETRKLESRVRCKSQARFGGGLGEKAERISLAAYPTKIGTFHKTAKVVNSLFV